MRFGRSSAVTGDIDLGRWNKSVIAMAALSIARIAGGGADLDVDDTASP